MDDKENETHIPMRADLMVVRREKYKLHLFCSANFKENGEKITILGGSRHIITHTHTQSNAGVNIMVFSNLHTHNNQRDTIGISSINKRRELLLGNTKKIWLSIYFYINQFPEAQSSKIELRKGRFADF